MFLEQQLIIQQAVRFISRLPEGVAWMLTVTNEDGEGEDGLETAASLNITAPRHLVTPTLNSTYGHWERLEPGHPDGPRGWWRADGDLEITVTEEGDE